MCQLRYTNTLTSSTVTVLAVVDCGLRSVADGHALDVPYLYLYTPG